MDGLLINSEDMITASINELLAKYNRPPLTRSIRTQMMGLPDSSNGDAFHAWAQLPIPPGEWGPEERANTRRHFRNCAPLPGAENLVASLAHGMQNVNGEKIALALASSTKTETFQIKMTRPETRRLLDLFGDKVRVLGDDPRVKQGRSKPAPDIYLIALAELNSSLKGGSVSPITPSECLAFEDSTVGMEAARRAGMRVVWVPHTDLVDEYGNLFADDAWVERIPSLEHFNCDKYGIRVEGLESGSVQEINEP